MDTLNSTNSLSTEPLAPPAPAAEFDTTALDPLRPVPMTVQVEVGRTTMRLGDILDELQVGSSIRLDRHAGDPVEVYVNGALFARAEVVVMQDQIGAKIIELVETPLRPAGLR
ncbi:MAG TPA: FliM/FliN family flagellar motor switch protein [Candidatus Binataceae bacterium]|nr:FliM/FliN family flagellar motor switch protein [Candidatus Binataceae bacterium]